MGGSIGFRSEEGSGATFHFDLPIASDRQPVGTMPARAED
jgi:signal transduction histidine kinase